MVIFYKDINIYIIIYLCIVILLTSDMQFQNVMFPISELFRIHFFESWREEAGKKHQN